MISTYIHTFSFYVIANIDKNKILEKDRLGFGSKKIHILNIMEIVFHNCFLNISIKNGKNTVQKLFCLQETNH